MGPIPTAPVGRSDAPDDWNQRQAQSLLTTVLADQTESFVSWSFDVPTRAQPFHRRASRRVRGARAGAVVRRTAAGGGDILPFQATERTLANGLKVIVVPTGFPNLVSIQIPVQAGSRNEVEPGKSGFAHFFEHLMFRGTPNKPPARFRQIMTKAGARDNAGTGDDSTRYYSTFAKEDLETIVGLYADMFQNLSYTEADFKTEARAILGEYNKNSADPLEKAVRGAARSVLPDAHLQAHDDGLHQRHREHAERVRLLEDVLRALVPAAVHDGHRRRRRDARAGAAAGREVLGRLEGGAARSR